jgi:hypothetical protein
MVELEVSSQFDGFYIEAIRSEDGEEVEIRANEAGLQYLRQLISKLIESNTVGKHFHLDRVGGLDGNIKSIVITNSSPPK